MNVRSQPPRAARIPRRLDLASRPDLLGLGRGTLDRAARAHIALVQRTLDEPRLDAAVRWLQRHLGSSWITFCTRNLRNVHGLERLPKLDPAQSFICVSNHRSFFDLYVVTAMLVARGLPQRILFPVRANFFYEGAAGMLVNGLMSFFAMYPPVFRDADKDRAALNLAGLDEVAWLLRRGGTFVGLHPEGTRKKDDDPYTFLPAQSGVGRVIHKARVPVVPVFVNGLGNDLVKQVASDIRKTGAPITVVFGEPVDFGRLLDEAPSPRTFRRISERALEAIAELGDEERGIRARLLASR